MTVFENIAFGLRRLYDDFHITGVFVTHDQEEALGVADRIVVLNKGKIEQIGTPEEVYDNPANPFVYDFLGNVSLFHGRVNEGNVHIGDLHLPAPEYSNSKNEKVIIFARPHNIEISKDSNAVGFIKASVLFIRAVGHVVNVELKRVDNDEYWEAEISKDLFKALDLTVGEEVFIKRKDLSIFTPEDYVI